MAKLLASLPKLASGAAEFSAPRLKTFWRYAQVEFKPPTPSEIPEVTKRLTDVLNAAKSGKWKNLTVKEGIVNAAIGAELLFLFFIGEVIGRGSLVGYDVSRVQPKLILW